MGRDYQPVLDWKYHKRLATIATGSAKLRSPQPLVPAWLQRSPLQKHMKTGVRLFSNIVSEQRSMWSDGALCRQIRSVACRCSPSLPSTALPHQPEAQGDNSIASFLVAVVAFHQKGSLPIEDGSQGESDWSAASTPSYSQSPRGPRERQT